MELIEPTISQQGHSQGDGRQKQRGTERFVPFFVGFRQMPRPGQSRERRPDNRHPSHSIEIRTRNLKESADRHGRHPRRFFPSFRCANHRPPGSAHTVQPRRHENTSPTGKPDYGEKERAVSSDRHLPYHHRHRFSPARSSSRTRISFSLSTPTPKKAVPF